MLPIRPMRTGPKLNPALAALGGTFAIAACTVAPPAGPTVMALPSQGKNLTVFQQEDAECRNYAGAPIGASNAAGSEHNLQTRYNIAYTQCMYSHGNSVRGPLYSGAGYPAYAGLYPYPSPWYGPGFYPGYGGGLFGSSIIVFGGNGHHFHHRFHHGFPGGFHGGGFAPSGLRSWRR